MLADGFSKLGVFANDRLVPERIGYEALSFSSSESRKHLFRLPDLGRSQSGIYALDSEA